MKKIVSGASVALVLLLASCTGGEVYAAKSPKQHKLTYAEVKASCEVSVDAFMGSGKTFTDVDTRRTISRKQFRTKFINVCILDVGGDDPVIKAIVRSSLTDRRT